MKLWFIKIEDDSDYNDHFAVFDSEDKARAAFEKYVTNYYWKSHNGTDANGDSYEEAVKNMAYDDGSGNCIVCYPIVVNDTSML